MGRWSILRTETDLPAMPSYNLFLTNWQQSIFSKSESLGSQKALQKRERRGGAGKNSRSPHVQRRDERPLQKPECLPKPQSTRVGPEHSPGLRADANRGPAAQSVRAQTWRGERPTAERAVLP